MSYIEKDLSERQKHLDLDAPCEFYYNERGKNKGKITNQMSKIKAREFLGEYVLTGNIASRNIHVCHKCKNGSTSATPCINPLHLYWGTAKENHWDIPEGTRKDIYNSGFKASNFAIMDKDKLSAIGKKNVVAMNEKNNEKYECKYCGKVANKGNIARWHNENCKSIIK